MEKQESRHSTGDGRIFAQRWPLVALFVIVLILFLVWVLSSPSSELYVVCQPGETQISPEELSPVDNQIIIIGPDDAVTRVKDTAGIELKPLRTCKVGYRGGLGTSSKESLPFTSSELGHMAMDLYELKPDQNIEDVLIRLNDAGRAQHVYAHPNYLVGLLGESSCGSPWEVVGSPWEVVGSPWEVVGSPWEVVGSPGGPPLPADVAAELFWNQWAFQQIGAGPFFTHTLESTLPTTDGAQVRVAVLDTSPFPEPFIRTATVEREWFRSSNASSWWTQTGEETSLDLTTYYTYTLPLTTTHSDPPDVSDHGLFVAGLIHAIAPESEIHLYRVLDEHGCGQVFTISEAILHFAEGVQEDAGSLDGAVINMSLGVHKPRTTAQQSGLSRAPQAWQAEASEDEALEDEEDARRRRQVLDILARDQIESLRMAAAFATEAQIVIVAAAGNDSYLASQEGLVLSPHYPAQYPSVIGVSASNAMRQRSCFSNWGDLAAPGGDGGTDSLLAEWDPDFFEKNPDLWGLDCLPLSGTCSGNCPHAVISLAYNEDTGEYGYIYWQGTSFSTPLVSGAAALLLDASSPLSGGGQAWLSPDQVFAALRCGAPTPDGVINIPASVYRCLP